MTGGGPIGWANHYSAQREQQAAEQPQPACRFAQGCHLVAPCNPGCGAPRSTAVQPGRHTVDTITSDALDQLYGQRDANERRAEVYGQAWKAAEQRAKQAEAAIARVRALPSAPQVVVRIHIDGPSEQNGYNRGWSSAISAVRAALDPQEPTP